MKILWSVRARREFRAIRAYIGRDSTYYADRLVGRIVTRIETTATSPNGGHRVHEYPVTQLREIHEYPYRLIYLASGDTLHVVAIVHFKQQLDT